MKRTIYVILSLALIISSVLCCGCTANNNILINGNNTIAAKVTDETNNDTEDIDEIIKSSCKAYERFIHSGKESDLKQCIPTGMIEDFKEFYDEYQNDFSEAELRAQGVDMLNRFGIKPDDGDTAFVPILYYLFDFYEDLSENGNNSGFELAYYGQKNKEAPSSSMLEYYLKMTTMNRDFSSGKMAELILSHINEVYTIKLTETNLPWGESSKVITAFLVKYDNTWMVINIEGSEING